VIDLHGGGGHHTAYSRAVLCEAKRRRWQVVSAMTAEAQLHSSYSGIRHILEDGCELVTVSGVSRRFHSRRLGWFEGQLGAFATIREAFARACRLGRPDAVFILDCDSWYPAAALLGSPTPGVRFATIALRVRCHHKQLGIQTNDLSSVAARLQRSIFERFLRSRDLAYVLTPDETLVDSYEPRSSERLRYLPDLAELPKLVDQQEARSALGLPSRARVILSYGSLSRRKGISELLNVLSDERCPPDVVALIAGEADPETTALLHSEAAERLRTFGRLHWLDGFLHDAATKLVFSSADVAWLGYRDFYNSSGFLWQASLAGLPIIGCKDGLIGYLVDRHELGLTVDPNDRTEVLAVIDALMNDHRRRSQIVANCLNEGAKHVPSHFGVTICDALEACTMREVVVS
jgi:glycosyltransferase involved in cell wall biosynthesis